MTKKILHLLTISALHLLAITVIIYSFLPIADWYFNNPTLPPSRENIEAKPLWGVDFYYTASLVNLLKDNFVLPYMGWGYAWFSGWPLLSSYPILNYYLILPFTLFFSLIDAIKVWMLVSLALYFTGLYAVFYVLSRNIVLSIILSIAGIYSVGVYGTLMWGGSLPSHATQAFFPWVLFFVIIYLRSHKKIYLFISSLIGGLAILSHPQVVIAYIYPSSVLLFLFSIGTMKFFTRIKSMFVFLAASFLIGFPLLYSSMGGSLQALFITDINKVASSTVAVPSGKDAETAMAIADFHKAQPYRIYIDTNTTFFIFLAISVVLFILSLIFKNRLQRIGSILPFLIIAIFSTAYVWMFAYGFSIYHGGWYRLFWAVPLWLGMLVAASWGAWQGVMNGFVKNKFIYFTIYFVTSVVIIIGGLAAIHQFSSGIYDKIILRSATSSAYPNILNLYTSDQEREKLKKTLIPSWMDGEDKQYRMYAGDQTINIWWSSLYTMPLARGYFDPPVSAQNKGYFFLTDASLSQSTRGGGEDQLVGEFHYPPDAALSNTLYFVDWYSIKYIESGPSMAAYTPLPKSFNNSTYIKQDERLDFNKEKYNTGDMSLHYYEVKDEYVSPILSATNAPTLGIIASDTGYEIIIRGLADMNMSSKLVIPIKLGQYIDRLKSSDFAAIDALIVYDYNYSNKGNAYRLLSDYLKKGKKLFIDTGVEVKEATSAELPEIFPMNQSERKPLGKTWDFEAGESELMKDIDLSAFDPPVFNDEAWSIAYPLDKSDLREGSKILLENKGKVVMIDYDVGGGWVLWSGFNLPYHTIRSHNSEEIRFFKKIIEELLGRNSRTEASVYDAQFINPQKRQIVVQKSKGVLFKEQAYDGWHASVNDRSEKIFKAGPAYPGFMYVKLPDNNSTQKSTITFSYTGSLNSWIVFVVASIFVILIIEEVFLKGLILGRFYKSIFRKSYKHIKTWWSKEDADE